MKKKMKIDSLVLFDANILFMFEGNLEIVCQFFSNILIYQQVYEEVVGQAVKDELDLINNKFHNITYVSDDYKDFYEDELVSSIEGKVVLVAAHNENSCLNCLYSRIDLSAIDYNNRICKNGLKYGTEECGRIKEEFSCRIRNRIEVEE